MAEKKRPEGLPESPPEIYVAKERRKINWKKNIFYFPWSCLFLRYLLFTCLA